MASERVCGRWQISWRESREMDRCIYLYVCIYPCACCLTGYVPLCFPSVLGGGCRQRAGPRWWCRTPACTLPSGKTGRGRGPHTGSAGWHTESCLFIECICTHIEFIMRVWRTNRIHLLYIFLCHTHVYSSGPKPCTFPYSCPPSFSSLIFFPSFAPP